MFNKFPPITTRWVAKGILVVGTTSARYTPESGHCASLVNIIYTYEAIDYILYYGCRALTIPVKQNEG